MDATIETCRLEALEVDEYSQVDDKLMASSSSSGLRPVVEDNENPVPAHSACDGQITYRDAVSVGTGRTIPHNARYLRSSSLLPIVRAKAWTPSVHNATKGANKATFPIVREKQQECTGPISGEVALGYTEIPQCVISEIPCTPVRTEASLDDTKVDRRSYRSSDKNDVTKNNLRIVLLNINSINDKKFHFCSNYMNENKNSIYALTELVAESSHTLDTFLNNHSSYPIISDTATRRVGIMIPKFLQQKFKILDTWFLLQSRDRNSQKICHTTTYQYSDRSSNIVFTVVYIAPDANDASFRALCDKMLDYSQQYKNYFFLGDLNRDQKSKENIDFFKIHLGGFFEQIVTKVTREKSRVTKNGTKSTSNTIIDLIFVKPQIKNRLKI